MRVTRRELLGVAIGALGFVMFMCSVPFDERSDEPEPPKFAATESPAAVLLVAGDIAGCGSFYRDDQTALLLDAEPQATVMPLGDVVYHDAAATAFRDCYAPSWGRAKARTLPIPGNHEYTVPGAQGYFDYFNGIGVDSGPAGHRARGYYATDIGAWRLYVLNSELRSTQIPAQLAWLQADLAANPRTCIAAAWHRPWFTSAVAHGPEAKTRGFVLALEQAGADLILASHNHHYERFAPQTTDGVPSESGIRAFVVGTGGHGSRYDFLAVPNPNSEVRAKTWGVLRLTLHADRYEWQFLAIADQTFADSGSALCSGASVDSLPSDTVPVPVESTAPPDSLLADTTPPPDTVPPPVDSAPPSGPPADTTPTPPADTTPTLPADTTPTPPPAPSITLTVKGELRDRKTYATLTWTGSSGPSLDVYRNGVKITVTENDGRYTNSRTYTGPGTYVYKVCEAGGAVCSNEASVTFN